MAKKILMAGEWGKPRELICKDPGLAECVDSKIELSRAHCGSAGKSAFQEMIGHSSPLVQVLELALRAARTNCTVLIQGETGTGKELLARGIHANSTRSSRAFVTLNCGAIPKDLFESQLFGHVQGSFTGAVRDRAGKAEAANGGTLFLDEIGEMPLDLQVKLLRFLQTGEIEGWLFNSEEAGHSHHCGDQSQSAGTCETGSVPRRPLPSAERHPFTVAESA